METKKTVSHKLNNILFFSATARQAYDQHMNLVLSDVEEVINKVELKEGSAQGAPQYNLHSVVRTHEMLYIRGDGVILVSPPKN